MFADDERLAHAKTKPRDLDCLRAPDPAAWNGLGRRKKRCRNFEAIGRAYQTRQRPCEQLDPYIHTPRALRDAVKDLVYRVRERDPYSSPTLSEIRSPNPGFISPFTPSLLQPQALSPPAHPSTLHPGELCIRGTEMDPDMSYVVARGRHARAPQEGYTVQEAAIDMYFAERQLLGALKTLAMVFFPGGLGHYDQMAPASGLEPLLDFQSDPFCCPPACPTLGKHMLTLQEFKVLNDIAAVLDIAHEAQELLSAEQTPTLSLMFPVYNQLICRWKEAADEYPALGFAIGAGIQKIKKYINKSRTSPIHILAMCLNPSVKYGYIDKHWAQDERNYARMIVKQNMLKYAVAQDQAAQLASEQLSAKSLSTKASSLLGRGLANMYRTGDTGLICALDDLGITPPRRRSVPSTSICKNWNSPWALMSAQDPPKRLSDQS
ncbi:hypothetical protein FRC09_001546 [Ceratobasidium sp. 395]|nr:hypothetical protein FRC09_001546 [Ceratobasidium sp. 395]